MLQGQLSQDLFAGKDLCESDLFRRGVAQSQDAKEMLARWVAAAAFAPFAGCPDNRTRGAMYTNPEVLPPINCTLFVMVKFLPCFCVILGTCVCKVGPC